MLKRKISWIYFIGVKKKKQIDSSGAAGAAGAERISSLFELKHEKRANSEQRK